jgi:aspartyl-tRNA(Asn)/glutamyl-tRNA(Gln) amidotransferase subunit B
VLSRGEKIVQETRGWDENTGKTFSQRKKESANDYRYFPDPDLPKLVVTEVFGKNYEKLPALPELPWEKRARLAKEFGFQDAIVEIYVTDSVIGNFFEDVVKGFDGDKELGKLASNYISSDLSSLMKAGDGTLGKVIAQEFIALMKMVKAGDVSSRGAKDTLAIMYKEGGEPKAIAEREGLIQKSDTEALKKIAQEIIDANTNVVAEYKAGKAASLQFLIGQGMKVTRGSANPSVLAQVFQDLLK